MTDLLTPVEVVALTLSLRVSFWATVLSLPIAVAVAWVLARCDFAGKTLVDVVIHLPLVLPPVVVGYLLLLAFGNQGPLGRLLQSWFGVTVAFTWKGAAIASAVMAFPLVVRAIRLSLDRRNSNPGPAGMCR